MMPQAQNFSLVGLFLQADIVVKAVMLTLAAASVIVWAIVLDKSLRLRALRRGIVALAAASYAERPVPLGNLPGLESGQRIIAAAGRLRFGPDEDRLTRKERLRETMRLALAETLRPLEQGLPFLATVGSAGPFVGLFGTVWGIMNSFTAIGNSGNTSLAVVAPGIAEALLATAVGLAAAIPAVLAYNRFIVAHARLRADGHAAIARLADAQSEAPGRPVLAAVGR